MQYIEKFIIRDDLSVILDSCDEDEKKTILIEKSVEGKTIIPFKETFDNGIKKLYINEDYLLFINREVALTDTNLRIIALNTGKEVSENKMSIYQNVEKYDKYKRFEYVSFPKRG